MMGERGPGFEGCKGTRTCVAANGDPDIRRGGSYCIAGGTRMCPVVKGAWMLVTAKGTRKFTSTSGGPDVGCLGSFWSGERDPDVRRGKWDPDVRRV